MITDNEGIINTTQVSGMYNLRKRSFLSLVLFNFEFTLQL